MTHFPSDAVCESRYVFPHTPPNHRALAGPFSDLDPPPSQRLNSDSDYFFSLHL